MSNSRAVSRSALFSLPDATCAFAEVLSGSFLVIDVRTPREFAEGSLPEARNFPIFDNDERRVIGTIYHQQGKEPAILEGLRLVEPHLQDFLDNFSSLSAKNIAVMCARGGMRSRSVVNLLRHNGFPALQLTGGYKQYRQYTLEQFAAFDRTCIILHGLTGTGKTRLLQKLSPVLDLEDYAQHQSSIFGGLNRQPRTQKWFDSYLLQAMSNLPAGPCFIEGESRQVSNIFLPAGLAQAMRTGYCVYVHAPLETRIQRILEDYPVADDHTAHKIEEILRSLQMRLGSQLVEKLCMLLRSGNLADLVAILLTEYYDKRYANSQARHSYSLTLSSENLDEAARALDDFRLSIVSGHKYKA